MTATSSVVLSIILPAYDEKERLPPYLSALAERLRDCGLAAEIIIVDDGSSREHRVAYEQAMRNIGTPIPIRLLKNSVNRGKGSAVRSGFAEARGAWVGYADADGSTGTEEIVRLALIAVGSRDVDGIFGARVLMLGRKVVRSVYRHVLGRIFATFAYGFLSIPVYDPQCGFKLFKRSALSAVLPLCREEGWLFDLESIAVGSRLGLRFEEVPVSWQDKPGSKVRVLADGFLMFIGLWRLAARVNALEVRNADGS